MDKISKNLQSKLKFISKKNFVPLHNPIFDQSEIKVLQKCIKSTFVSTSGKEIRLFEKKIQKFTKVKHAVAVVNGTSALFLVCKSLNIDSNHEVLVPSMTFVGTVNAISYCGAIPHFVDSESETMGIDFEKLDKYLKQILIIKKNNSINKKTKKIVKFIMPVHLFGHPIDVEKCLVLAKKYKLTIIEDAAEALGSYYKKIHVGNFGIAGALSFNGNKIITTGGGGAVMTNSKILAKKIRHISSTAKMKNKSDDFSHDMIGYNFRMPNINAALGCAQIEKLNKFLKKKRELSKKYQKVFKSSKYFDYFEENKSSKSNYWLQVLILKRKYSKYKKKIIFNMRKKGYEVRPVWRLIHTLKPYKNMPKMNLSNSIDLHRRIINIPSSADLY